MDISELDQIIKILKQNDVTEFELVQGGTSIKLSRGKLAMPVVTAPAAPGAALTLSQPTAVGYAVEAQPADAPKVVDDEGRYLKVPSPIVGTFYRKPSPDAEPFVKEGDNVKKGQTLCIIEAMKLMNEIEAPCAGRVYKTLLSDGQVVEFGETIFLIDPD